MEIKEQAVGLVREKIRHWMCEYQKEHEQEFGEYIPLNKITSDMLVMWLAVKFIDK